MSGQQILASCLWGRSLSNSEISRLLPNFPSPGKALENYKLAPPSNAACEL